MATFDLPLTLDGRAGFPGCEKLDNFRLDEDGRLTNDRGWEPLKQLFSGSNTIIVQDLDLQPCRALHVHQRHGGTQTYYIERRGVWLYYTWGNGINTAGTDRIFLENSGFGHVPSMDEAGDQLVSNGDIAIICNGHDRAFKFFGNELKSDFGLTAAPPPPRIPEIYPLFRASGSFTSGNGQADGFGGSNYYGLVRASATGIHSWGYKVSYVTDTGCEGPLSDEASVQFNITDSGVAYRYMVHGFLPIGPKNVVARRIYRTHQRQAGDVGTGDFYFVKQIDNNSATSFSDHLPDQNLTEYAPGYGGTPGELIIPMTWNFKFGEFFDSRLWLTGGDLETAVVYSAKPTGNPPKGYETFEAQGRISIGGGGRPTGLKASGRHLILLRERQIDVINADAAQDGRYTLKTLSTTVGTVAVNTIADVPELGTVFLAADGIWAITDVETVPRVQKLSSQVDKLFLKRLNVAALARATACWNPVEREYWVHFPADGNTENSLGIVMHVPRDAFRSGGSGIRWTRRTPPPGDRSERMGFTQLSYDPRTARTIMGTVPWSDGYQTGQTISNYASGTWRNVGPQVWSAARSWGDNVVNPQYVTPPGEPGGTQNLYMTGTAGERYPSVIESNWLDLGFHGPKVVKDITLGIAATGYHDLKLIWSQDGDVAPRLWTTCSIQPAIHPERARQKQDHVFGSGSSVATVARWGSTVVGDRRDADVTFNIQSKELNTVKFRLESVGLISVDRITVTYEPTASPRPGGKGRA
jgi:hypothetical protein